MPHSNSFFYEFHNFRLDASQRVLSLDGQSIPLTPKATEVLLILVQNAGQLIEKDVLINQVWPDAFVEEANLTQNIFLLRRALQDDGNKPEFIETVARRGYRFIAPVQKVEKTFETDSRTASEARTWEQPILAVMPFVNATGDLEQQYLAEGIPESIINSLSGLSQLRVISRSTAFRYRNREIDPQIVGQKLGADVLLIGKIGGREASLSVAVELVNVVNGWQLWGQTFGVDSDNIFDIQDQIITNISRALDLPLSREDEKRVAKRFTEDGAAYQAYLEGRFHWSRYTRAGIEKAIGHFGRAIDLDPNYALAYAGIVDCYLRLATNYLPPEDDLAPLDEVEFESGTFDGVKTTSGTTWPKEGGGVVAQEKVKLRHEWDWKGAERELRRANELKTDYPAAHQWHAAYLLSRELYHRSQSDGEVSTNDFSSGELRVNRSIASMRLTASERVQVLCTVTREQIDSGNYDAACKVLAPWWTWGDWPSLRGLKPESCADLLFTAGRLASCVASARQIPQGQKHGEALLNGALALFESLGAKSQSAEAQMEIALCYYRQGLFDLGRLAFERTLSILPSDNWDLRGLCLIRLASLERHAGRAKNALLRLDESKELAGFSGPWATGRCLLEYASTYKDLAQLENSQAYYNNALSHYKAALRAFEAIGNHRLAAISENNLGYMLIRIGSFNLARSHLQRAQRMFHGFKDRVLGAQVNDSLARLYLAEKNFEFAAETASQAVKILEEGDEDVLLAEALITKGIIHFKMNRSREGGADLERAYRICERCGDWDGAGRALVIIAEETINSCDVDEIRELRFRVINILDKSGPLPIRYSLENTLRSASERIEASVLNSKPRRKDKSS